MLGGGQILTQRQKAPLPVGGSRPQTVTWSLQPLHRYLGQVATAPPAPHQPILQFPNPGSEATPTQQTKLAPKPS